MLKVVVASIEIKKFGNSLIIGKKLGQILEVAHLQPPCGLLCITFISSHFTGITYLTYNPNLSPLNKKNRLKDINFFRLWIAVTSQGYNFGLRCVWLNCFIFTCIIQWYYVSYLIQNHRV